MKVLRTYHNREAQPSLSTKTEERLEIYKDKTNDQRTNKEELMQRNHLGIVSRKQLQSILVNQKSKVLFFKKILQDIHTLTYQFCRIEGKIEQPPFTNEYVI